MAGERADQLRLDAFVLLLGAHTALTRSLSRELEEECGVPLAWYEVLVRLERAPGAHLRLSELAGSLMISTSGTTRLVDRMETAGLIRREPCPGDRRVVHVTLTDHGEELLERAIPVHLRGVKRHLGKLPARTLTALVDALRELQPDGGTGCDVDAPAADVSRRRRKGGRASVRSA